MTPPWSPAAALSGASYSAVELGEGDDRIHLLDQRLLPGRETYLTVTTWLDASLAITDMVVRGAPAIGITAAYGLVLAARAVEAESAEVAERGLAEAARTLEAARPTAVNLAWAVRRMLGVARVALASGASGRDLTTALAADARRIHTEDVAACRAMGRLGAELLPSAGTVLTHCNAGALATGGYGTALGVIRAAFAAGKRLSVLADETRPYLQGARLTAWELHRDGVPVEVIADSMAGHFMKTGRVRAVVVGADRIAANGDVANKIGTYGLACLARAHDVPFYVAAPLSTFDPATAHGDDIVIEERSRSEMAVCGGATVVPDGVGARHPAFDVTPAALISKIVTERGVVAPADVGTLASQPAR